MTMATKTATMQNTLRVANTGATLFVKRVGIADSRLNTLALEVLNQEYENFNPDIVEEAEGTYSVTWYNDEDELQLVQHTYHIVNFNNSGILLQQGSVSGKMLYLTGYNESLIRPYKVMRPSVEAPTVKTATATMTPTKAEQKPEPEPKPTCTIAPYIKYGETDSKSYIVTTEDSKFLAPVLDAVNWIRAKSGGKKPEPKFVPRRCYLPISRLDKWGGLEKFIKECESKGIKVTLSKEPVMGEPRTESND